MQSENFDLSPVIVQIAQYGDKKLAIEVLEAFAENAKEFAQYETLAKSYSQLGQYAEAIKYSEKALAVCENPEIKDALNFNLIPVYRNAAVPEKALNIIEYFENKNPDPVFQIEKAGCLYELNKREESFEILDSIDQSKLQDFLKLKLESQIGNKNLWHGNLKKGLAQTIVAGSTVRDMESPVKGIFHSRKELSLPFWEGTPDCKNLIIYAEAGVGDEILNVRFIKHLKDRGINAVWYGAWHDDAVTNKRLGVVDVFRKSGFPVVTKLSEISNIQDYMWTYSQYLPINLGLEEKNLWHGPYLKAGTKNLPKDKKNIGIRWYGNPVPMHRNYPLKNLYSVLKNFDANFYSLQKDIGMEEICDFPGIIDLSSEIESFEDTASYINSMDIIITSCTSIAHCAAALGKETYIIVPISAYYPWCHASEKSPWYGDNVTLLRQKTPRVWDEPMEELAAILKEKNL
jgi:hypothetical protein